MKCNQLLSLLMAIAVAATLGGCDEADDQSLDAAPPGESASAQDEHAHEGPEEESAAHADEVRLADEAIRSYGVVVEPAQRRAVADLVVAPARVGFNAESMAHVGSLVHGRVTEIKVRLGDRVEPGDVLLVIESAELGQRQSDFLSKRAALEAARPAIELARTSYERAKQVYDETEGIALAEVQRRQAELATAQRELIVAEAEVAAASNALRLHGMGDEEIDRLAADAKVRPQFEVRAPIAGQVVEREVTPGELVGPDDETLIVLGDLSTLWVLADVAEAKLATLGIGSSASVEMHALPGRTFEGTVTYVSPEVNQATRTARLRIEVRNRDGLLRPGMFAHATLGPAGGGGELVLALPAAAVMSIEGEPSVFVPVENEPNTFARRVVAVGTRAGGFVSILSGIEEGQPVVVAGTFILKAELGKAGAAHEH